METLFDCAQKYKSDKCIAFGHNYLPGYESLFGDVRSQVKVLLEIGIGNRHHEAAMQNQCPEYRCGNSLRMWREYFSNAKIYSIDIAPDCMIEGENRIQTFVANQASETDLSTVLMHIGEKIDVIIDDGSHQPFHQAASFEFLYKNLNKNGIYVIEDVHPTALSGFVDLSRFSSQTATIIRQEFDTQVIDSRWLGGPVDDLMFVLKKKN